MKPKDWKHGDVTKLQNLSEDGRKRVIDLLEWYLEDEGLQEESAMAVETVLEALGAEGYEFN